MCEKEADRETCGTQMSYAATDLEKLRKFLKAKKELLTGDWIKRDSSYDGDICKILGMEEQATRYWDARWEGFFLEFKKGKSIWLDLVRYSEMILRINTDASKETVTLFFIPDQARRRIQDIVCAETNEIIKHLRLDLTSAKLLLELNKEVPRSLNAQASLTTKNVKSIACFSV